MKKKIIISLLFVLVSALIANAQQQYEWKVATNKMPRPVWGAQVVYDQQAASNKIYVLGGYSDSLQKAVDWIQEYDVSADSWKIVAHMKQPRHLFVADIWKTSVIYFGGTSDTSATKNSVESWTFKPTISDPVYLASDENFGRTYSTGHIKGDSLYIIGGNPISGSSNLPYIAEYNLNLKSFGFTYIYTAGDVPEQHMTMNIGDNIYIFGGVFNGIKDWIRKFNIPSKQFETLTEKLPSVRANGAAVYNSISEKGYIIGGYNETTKALKSVEEVTILPNGTLQFTPNFPDLNYARTNLMAVSYQQFVVVLGGKDIENKVVPYVELLQYSSSTAVGDSNIPQKFELSQNYPNPFNPSTVINYQLSTSGWVTLNVYDVLGRQVASLVNEYKQPGNYKISFDAAQTFNHQPLHSGIYFYRLTSNDFSETKKMILMK